MRRDWGRARFGLWALVGALVLVGMGSAGAAVALTRKQPQVHAAGTGPCNDPSPGECTIDHKSHCPIDGPLGTNSGRCEQLSAQLVTIVTQDSGGGTGCVTNDYVQVEVPTSVEDYEAVWYSDIGEGTRWWQSPGTTWPNSVTGEGASYKVPKGYAAWSAAGGAQGSGPCPSGPPAGTFGVKAWGIPSCGGNAASRSAHVAAGACCLANPMLTGRATRDTSNGDVTIDLTASRLGKISKCGRAKMSITDPGHGTMYLRVNQHGSSATARRDLTGSDECLDLTRATVSVPKGGEAYREVQVPDSNIVIVSSSTTAHRTPQGAIALTVVAKHFLPACGKRDFTWMSSDGTDKVPIVRVKGSTATAKRTLPSGQDCAPDGTILVVQPHDPWSHATREVAAPTPDPPVCKSQGT